jgi:hypothetical protein
MGRDKKVGVHGSDTETGRKRGDNAPDASGKPAKKPDISKEDFEAKAPQVVELGKVFTNKFANKKTFAKGGYGYFLSDKVFIEIDGKPVKLQVTINASVVHGKPKDADNNGTADETE